MKRVEKIGRILLLPILCLTLVLLAGCNQKPATTDTIEVSPSDLAGEDCLGVTLVNASGVPVGSVIFEWYDERDQDYRMNALADGDILEPDGVRQILLPEYAVSYDCMPCDTEDGLNIGFYFLDRDDMEDGCVLVLPPADDSYSNYGIQLIFAPGTEAEKAKESVLADYQEAADDGQEAQEPEDGLSPEQIEAAVSQLGYDSLADMRMQEHADLTVTIDYRLYPEEEPNRDIYELYGYWYPDGDQNSLTYFSISDMGVQWYSFDPEKGDVLTDSQRITSRVLKKYSLSDGRSFTASGSTLGFFAGFDVSTDWLSFDDDGTEYRHSDY